MRGQGRFESSAEHHPGTSHPEERKCREIDDDVLSLPGNLSQRTNIASFIFRVDVCLPGNQQLYGILDRVRLQLPYRNPCAWYFLGQRVLDRASFSFGEASLSVTSTIICA